MPVYGFDARSSMFKLIVEEIDVNGCSGFDSIWVQIHDLPYPKISALGPTSFCQGDYVMLQLDSIYTQIIWNNGANTSTIYADSSADYLEHKFTTEDGFQIGYGGSDIKSLLWFMTLEKYGDATVLFKDHANLKNALEAGQNKIKELKAN